MNKTPEQINRFIHEAMNKRKNCLHKNDGFCPLCIDALPDYLEHGKPWGEMLRWSMEQDWWSKFIMHVVIKGTLDTSLKNDERSYQAYIAELKDGSTAIVDLFTDPPALATKITEYLEGRDDDTK